jgi:hypothetical protein
MTEIEQLKSDLQNLKKASARQASLETVLKFVGAMITLATVAIGVFQYLSSRQNEFRKTFWSEQLGMYRKASSAAAAIAIAADIDSVKAERKVFWNLYWGELSIIEHPEVKDAMVGFGRQLTEVEEKRASTASLKLLSFELARACRRSLAKTWNPVDIGDLDNKP